MQWIKPGAEFADLLRSFKRTAWRWECQGTYREPDEQEPLQAWRAGRPTYEFMSPWLDQIRHQLAEGKTFERVRMIPDPPTEYVRWLYGFTHLNVSAGEDIRWIDEEHARELGAPTRDFYLFDDQTVGILHFGDNGVSGVELTDEPGTVAEHQRWKDRVWPVAVPHSQQLEPTTRSP